MGVYNLRPGKHGRGQLNLWAEASTQTQRLSPYLNTVEDGCGRSYVKSCELCHF